MPRRESHPVRAQRPAGMRLRMVLVARFVVEQVGGEVGGDVAGRDGVDLHALAGPFIAQCLRQPGDGALAGCVGRHTNAALKAHQRSDEDDLAATARQHFAPELAGEDELRVQVDLEHVIP